MNHQNRRVFIRNLVLAGAAIYLPACKNEPKPTTITQEKVSPNQVVQEQKAIQEQEIEQIVQQIEEQFESENLVLLRADNEEYKNLNIGFNKRVPKAPKIIALCKNETGISEAIKYAKQFDLQVCVKSGGHSFEGFSSNNGGMSINLSLLNQFEWLDEETVKMGSGVK
jgi:FAD/FMN-containing dehydrogenase